jgi:hypothetical protein
MKKGVGSGVGYGAGSGSISQRYGSGHPDPHQNVTDPQHCCFVSKLSQTLQTFQVQRKEQCNLID